MTPDYREWVEDEAARLGSDGTTMGFGWFLWCSKEHDVLYRRGTYRDGTPIVKRDVDKRYRSCIQRHSKTGWWNPVAWYRWVLVSLLGKPAGLRERARTIGVSDAEVARLVVWQEVFSGR